MVKEFNQRLKTWTMSTCIIDVMKILIKNMQTLVNYANNNDAIITTLDKLYGSNPHFRDFIVSIENSQVTNMLK